MYKQYTITKKIAKHGSQAIIIIPRLLEKDLKPGTVAKVTIDVLEQSEQDTKKPNGFLSVIGEVK